MRVVTSGHLFFLVAGIAVWLLVHPGVSGAADDDPAELRIAQGAVQPPPRSARGNQTEETAAVAGTAEAGAKEAFVTIDFDNVDIGLFIKYISELTGKNFVVDKAVRGNVTIISPTRISVDEAYKVFESVLEVQGFATVPAGSIIKILPAVEARAKNIETGVIREGAETTDQVVTQIIPLAYADPDELKTVFAPLVSKTSVVISYPATRMLIVTDTLSNIQRLLRIIVEIDVPEMGEEINILALRNAPANEIAKSLNALFQQTGGSTPAASAAAAAATPAAAAAARARRARSGAVRAMAVGTSVVKIIPDERTNLLIVLATPDDLAQVKELVEILDQEVPRGSGNIQVYYLQHANAEELSKVLTSLPTQQAGQVAEKGTAPVLSEDVRIVADSSTNSLVITAKKADYLVLEDVIKKLDIPRRMVYIEALIMEVNVDKRFSLGVEWRALSGVSEGAGVVTGFGGGTDFANLNRLTVNPLTGTLPSLPGDFSLGVVGDIIEVNGVFFPTLGAMVQAIQNDGDINIIATPQLLTTDNEEAQIKVGENVPYLSKEEQSSSGLNFSTYEYKDVGLTMKITPQINQEGIVRLKIFQEVIRLKETVNFRPTTLQRSAETTVIVKDANTMVIAGLIDETLNDSYRKVPLLGDIPLLGALFRSHATSTLKTNLFIFLTPHIINNPSEANDLYEKKRGEARTFVKEEVYATRLAGDDDMELADLGYTKLREGDYEAAKKYLAKSLQINPDNPYALINLGVIYGEEGRTVLAAAMYERVIALDANENAASSTDPALTGLPLAEIARRNLVTLEAGRQADNEQQKEESGQKAEETPEAEE